MDDILQLAKHYSKSKHIELLTFEESSILQKLKFIYDDKWESQSIYPYEILTYLFDSYYVLPERPDLATLFCWQAINHSYYSQQLGDKSVKYCQDSKGIELIVTALLSKWDKKYGDILEPFLEKLPIKTFRYVASYMLKGYALEMNGIDEKYGTSSYKSLKKRVVKFYDILSNSYGKTYCQIARPEIVDNHIDFRIAEEDKEKSRNITHSFALKLRELIVGKEIEITSHDVPKTIHKYMLTTEERLSFMLFGILYASRCNNFHGNVAARMNSVNANRDTFKMYTDLFLIEYMILAVHLNSRGILSDSVLDELKKNAQLML